MQEKNIQLTKNESNMQPNSLHIETNRREYKEQVTENLEKEVVAFLNSNGGRIYIGIRKDGEVVGVDNPDEMQLQIKDRLINNIRPGILGLFDIFYEGKGKLLNAHFAKTLDFLTVDGKYNQLAFLFSDKNSISIRVAKWWGTDKIDLRENEEYGECSLIKSMQKVLDKFDIENVTFARKVGIGPREERKLVDSKALREAIVNAFAHNDYTVGDTPIFEIFANRFEFTTYGGLVEGLTHEEFFEGVSRPRNPEIMRIFKDLEYVERLGSGIPYIVSKYGKEIFKLMSSVTRYAYMFDEVIETEETAQTTPKTTSETIQKTTSKLSKNYPKTIQKSPKNHLKTTQKSHKTIQKPHKNHIKTTQKSDTVMADIQNNPFISLPDLAKASGITVNQIRGRLEKLKKTGLIRRVGAKKGGYWEIIQNDANTE